MESINNHGNGINEVILQIKSLGGVYNPESSLSLHDQLLICETLAESTPVDYNNLKEQNDHIESVSGNGSVNGSYKRQENAEETQKKLQAITELKACNYRTPPKVISLLLEQLFSSNKSNDGHWLYVAQHYSPKSINSVIARIQKIHATGVDTIQNPSAYFTKLIQYHPKRKLFRANKRAEM